MKLKYKNTEFIYKITLTDSKVGLPDDDVWLNFETEIINDEIDLKYNRSAFSYKEFVSLNEWIVSCINGNKEKNVFKFIRHFDELIYDKKNKNFRHKFYNFANTKEYYELTYEKDEILHFVDYDNDFLESIKDKINFN